MTKAEEVMDALQDDVAFVCYCLEKHLQREVSPSKATNCRNCGATYVPYEIMNESSASGHETKWMRR